MSAHDEQQAKTKKQSRNEPRDLVPFRAWYYVNRASIDLMTRQPNVATITTRLTRRTLKRMLDELEVPHA